MTFKIFRYSFSDLIRSRWSLLYFLFYFCLALVLLFMNNDSSKAVITLLNIVVILTPMIGTLFGIMYFYNSREFAELLMAQPIKRSSIFLGMYLGLSVSLSASLILGLGIPFLLYGVLDSAFLPEFVLLMINGALLTMIFTALAFNIGLRNDNKIKGFGYSILLWLLLVVIYDGIFLLGLLYFSDYPIEKFALILSVLNPVDLARISILLKLDISALFGYTGAVFQRFFGSILGVTLSVSILVIWVIVPVLLMIRKAGRKDF